MKKALQFLRKNPEIIFFICAFILWTALMGYENTKDGEDFSWHDIKVEANGMIFDLFVFGILVTVYNAIRARKEKIERLKEEIDDYRGWDEKEAMYRIVGAIKRLNKEGVTKIKLRSCFLTNSNLSKVRLQGSNLQDAKLEGAYLFEANLKGALLRGAQLQGALLPLANLLEADLSRANLSEPNLDRAIVGKGWFEKLEDWKVVGREEIKENYIIDETGILHLK